MDGGVKSYSTKCYPDKKHIRFFLRCFKHRPGQENVAEGAKTTCYECAIKGFCGKV